MTSSRIFLRFRKLPFFARIIVECFWTQSYYRLQSPPTLHTPYDTGVNYETASLSTWCSDVLTPALQYPWCQKFWNYSLQNSYSYKSLLCFDSKHYQSHLDSLFISYFPFLYTYIVHVAPGSLLFTRASFLFFSSSLCFAAIIGHRSLFYGMDFRFGMVSHSGCFYSHFATPCLVSCPMISGRCMVLWHLDSSRGR